MGSYDVDGKLLRGWEVIMWMGSYYVDGKLLRGWEVITWMGSYYVHVPSPTSSTSLVNINVFCQRHPHDALYCIDPHSGGWVWVTVPH